MDKKTFLKTLGFILVLGSFCVAARAERIAQLKSLEMKKLSADSGDARSAALVISADDIFSVDRVSFLVAAEEQGGYVKLGYFLWNKDTGFSQEKISPPGPLELDIARSSAKASPGLAVIVFTWKGAASYLEGVKLTGLYRLSQYGRWVTDMKDQPLETDLMVAKAETAGSPVPSPAPTGLTAERSGGRAGIPDMIHLFWDATSADNTVAYNIYRANASEGPFTRINLAPVFSTIYAYELNVPAGDYYAVTAVARDGSESPYSAPAAVTVTTQEEYPDH